MFVPFHVQDEFREAHIRSEKGLRPLVMQERKIVDTHPTPGKNIWDLLTPTRLAWILFIFILGTTFYELKCKKCFWGIDLCIFTIAGLAGCIIAFLVFFSQHPAVSPNYLIIVFHPLHLLCIPFMLKRIRKQRLSLYLMANLIVLTFFIALWPVIPQRFDFAVLPLALGLITRSGGNLITSLNRQKN